MIILFTDGEFCDVNMIEQETYKIIKKNKIYVALIKINSCYEFNANKRNNYSKIVSISSFSELSRAISKVVTDFQSKVIKNIV